VLLKCGHIEFVGHRTGRTNGRTARKPHSKSTANSTTAGQPHWRLGDNLLQTGVTDSHYYTAIHRLAGGANQHL